MSGSIGGADKGGKVGICGKWRVGRREGRREGEYVSD